MDPEEQVRDILAARIWLSARDDVSQVAVMGLSHGGGASIKATAVDLEIVALATVGAPGDGERWHRGRGTRVAEGRTQERQERHEPFLVSRRSETRQVN